MAYSGTYTAADLGPMIIDVVGALFNGIATNASTIAVLIIVALVATLAVDALTGVFGVVKYLRKN